MGAVTRDTHGLSLVEPGEEHVGLVLRALRGLDDVAVVTPGDQRSPVTEGDIVVVTHVAIRDDRILVRVGLDDREPDSADPNLRAGPGASRGRSQGQVLGISLDG